MRKLIALTVLVSFIAFGFTSCSKYEEGPSLSLRTKMSRMTGTWKLDKATDNNGAEVGSYSDDYTYTFNEDGSFTFLDRGTTVSGEWKFNDEKTEIETIYPFFGLSLVIEFEIIRLTNKELILDRKPNSTITEGHRMYFDKQ